MEGDKLQAQHKFITENKTDYWYGDGIPIVVFHGVSDTELHNWSIGTKDFKNIISWLKGEGYETITMEEFYRWHNNNFTLPNQPIILTFDDSLKSVYDNAKDIMKENNFKGVLFAITRFLNASAYFQDQKCMSWKEVRELQDNYGWEIGSHTAHHVNGKSKSFGREVNWSYKDLQNNINKNQVSFAYPNYIIDDSMKNVETVAAFYKVARAGYQDAALNTKSTDIMRLKQNAVVRRETFDFENFREEIRGDRLFRSSAVDTFTNIPMRPFSSFQDAREVLFKFNITEKLTKLTLIMLAKNTTENPFIVSYSDAIKTITADYVNNGLTVSCTGNGEIAFSNMQSIIGEGKHYVAYKNNLFVESTGDDMYTISGCDTWSFEPETLTASLVIDQSEGKLTIPVLFISLLFFILIVLLVLLIYERRKNRR
jgi:peptidoglycan/xylan/chitin deacetylase (PgdA/CDA1 family)